MALRRAGKSWNYIRQLLSIIKSSVRSVYNSFLKRGNGVNKINYGRPSKVSQSACRLIKRKALSEQINHFSKLKKFSTSKSMDN